MIYESTRAPLRGPPSPMGKVKRRRLRRKKGSQPRLAALSSPFQGKGLAWMLPPSFGRRCPEGAEVGGGKRYPRHTVFPSRGRCPEGADRVALRYIPHCSITASMPLLPSALPPKGEARRYVTNDFLNLIALPMRRRLIWRRLRREYMGRCPKSGIQVTSHQSLATNPQSLVPFLLAVLTEPVDLNARIGRSEVVLL